MAVISVAVWAFLSLEALVLQCNAACTYNEFPAKTATGFETGQGTANLAECTTICTADVDCLSGHFDSGIKFCYIHHSERTPTDAPPQVTFFKKQCDPCSMDRTANTKGGLTNVQLTLTSAEHCCSACLHVSQCKGVTYSGGTCNIYGGTASEANTGDSLNYYKQSCSTGTQCCMTSTTTFKADGAAMLTLTSSIESCESVCMMTTNCISVYFANDVCFVYTNGTLTTTSAQTGSTYSTKTCTDTQTASGTITDVCIGARAGGSTPVHGLYHATSMLMLMLLKL